MFYGRKEKRETQEMCKFFSRVGVSEVGFATTALAHGNLWFGKKKDGEVWDKESLILGGHVVHHGVSSHCASVSHYR